MTATCSQCGHVQGPTHDKYTRCPKNTPQVRSALPVPAASDTSPLANAVEDRVTATRKHLHSNAAPTDGGGVRFGGPDDMSAWSPDAKAPILAGLAAAANASSETPADQQRYTRAMQWLAKTAPSGTADGTELTYRELADILTNHTDSTATAGIVDQLRAHSPGPINGKATGPVFDMYVTQLETRRYSNARAHVRSQAAKHACHGWNGTFTPSRQTATTAEKEWRVSVSPLSTRSGQKVTPSPGQLVLLSTSKGQFRWARLVEPDGPQWTFTRA